MKRQPRLSRSQVLARLRAHAARHGAVSPGMLHEHDRIVLRSLLLHFPSFEAARRAARVPAAAPRRREPARRRARNALWSRARVIAELRRLDRGGRSTMWPDLMHSGRADLVGAAAVYAGGLRHARRAAGARPAERRVPVARWHRAAIAAAIRDRARSGQTLASSKAPPHFVAAARWHFGSWTAALAAAGVDAQAVRLQRRPYTPKDILALLRQHARQGKPLRASALRTVVKLDTVRKLFGSLEAAIRAAGIAMAPGHANQKWSRARLIEVLRDRARQGKPALTHALHSAAQLYFGGARAARAAAGLPALLRAPWTRETLIRELKRRARDGDSGSTLWRACARLFGSVAAARRAAGVPATQRDRGMVAWSKSALLAELRRRVQAHQQLSRGLSEGLRRQFGSLSEARAKAGLPHRRRAARAGARAAVSRGTKLRGTNARGRGANATSRGVGAIGRGTKTRGRGANAVGGVATRRGVDAIGRGRKSTGRGVNAVGGVAATRRGADAIGRGTKATSRGAAGPVWRRWSREQVIEKLRAWSASGERLRQDIFQACKHHFGSLERACAEAGVPIHAIAWTPDRIRRALRDPRFDVIDPSFVAACVYHFGSVTAARAAARANQRAWSKETVIAELLARARRGLKGVGRLLREPAVRLFGSTDAALQAAARSGAARHGASSRRDV